MEHDDDVDGGRYGTPEHEAELAQWEREYEESGLGAYGDPRRCDRHPNQVTSSPDGMFDTPCGACEWEHDEALEADADLQADLQAAAPMNEEPNEPGDKFSPIGDDEVPF